MSSRLISTSVAPAFLAISGISAAGYTTAEVPIEDLYAGGRLEFEFERTRSRLLEMQSQEYLAREHLA